MWSQLASPQGIRLNISNIHTLKLGIYQRVNVICREIIIVAVALGIILGTYQTTLPVVQSIYLLLKNTLHLRRLYLRRDEPISKDLQKISLFYNK